MYDNNGNETNTNSYPQRGGMARASFMLGIISVMLCSIFYISLPCGALAILCALLSRTEKSRRFDSRCKFAIISGLCGIAATVILTGTSMYRLLTDPQQRALLEYYLQAYTGDSTIMLEDLFPFLAEDDAAAPDTQIPYEAPQNLKDGEEVFL